MVGVDTWGRRISPLNIIATKVDLKQNLSYNQLVECRRFTKLFSFSPQLLPNEAMRSIAKH